MLDFNNPDKYNKKQIVNDQEEYVKSTPTVVTDVVESNVQQVLDKNIESEVTEKGDLFSNLRDAESPVIEDYKMRPDDYKEGGVLYQDDILIAPDDQQGTLAGLVDRGVSAVTAGVKGVNDFTQSVSRLPEDFDYLKSLQDAQGTLTEQVPTGVPSQNISGASVGKLSGLSGVPLQEGNNLDPITAKQNLINAKAGVERENLIGQSKADWFGDMDPMNDMIDIYDKKSDSFGKMKRRDAHNIGGEIIDVSTQAIGAMAPGLAISAANPYVGAGYFASLGGGKYDENRRRGASVGDSMGDAAVNAASEVLSDLILAGALKPVSKISSGVNKIMRNSNSEMEILTKLLAKYPVSGKAAKELAERIVGGGLGEGMESVATQISDDMLIKDKTWDESKLDWKEIAMSAASGGLIGSVMKAPNIAGDIKGGIAKVSENAAVNEVDNILDFQDEVLSSNAEVPQAAPTVVEPVVDPVVEPVVESNTEPTNDVQEETDTNVDEVVEDVVEGPKSTKKDTSVKKEVLEEDLEDLDLDDVHGVFVENSDGTVDYVHTDDSVHEFESKSKMKKALKEEDNLIENEFGEMELKKDYQEKVWNQKGNKLESKSWKAVFYPERNVTVLESKTTKKGQAGREKLSYVGKKDKLFDKMIADKSIGNTYNQEVRENKDRYATVFENKNFKPGTAKATKTKMLGEVYNDIINNNANELNPDGLQYINFEKKTSESKLVNTALVAAGRNAVFGEGNAVKIRETLEYIKNNEANSKSSKAKIDEALNVLDTKKFSSETYLINALNTTKDKLDDVTDDIKKKHLKTKTPKKPTKKTPKKPTKAKKTKNKKVDKVEKAVDSKLKEKKATKEEVKSFLDKLVEITNDVNYKIDTTMKRIWNKIKDLARNSGFADLVNDYIFNPKNGLVMAAIGSDTGIDGSIETRSDMNTLSREDAMRRQSGTSQVRPTTNTTKKEKKSIRNKVDSKLEDITNIEKANKKLDSIKNKELQAKTKIKSVKKFIAKFEGNAEVSNLIEKYIDAQKGRKVVGLEKKIKKYLRKELSEADKKRIVDSASRLANTETKRNVNEERTKVSDVFGLLSIDGMLNIMGKEYVEEIGDKLDKAETIKNETFNNRQNDFVKTIAGKHSGKLGAVKDWFYSKNRKLLNKPFESDVIENKTLQEVLPLAFTPTNELTYKSKDVTTKLSKEETAQFKADVIKQIKDNNLEQFVENAFKHTNLVSKEINESLETSRLKDDVKNNNSFPVYKDSEIDTFENIIKNKAVMPVSSSNPVGETTDPAANNSLDQEFRNKYSDKRDSDDKDIAIYSMEPVMDILYDFNKDASSLMAYEDIGSDIKNILKDEKVIKNMKGKIGVEGVKTLNKMINNLINNEVGTIKGDNKKGDTSVSLASKIFYPLVLAYNLKVAAGQAASIGLGAINSDLTNKTGLGKVVDHGLNFSLAHVLLLKNIAMRTAGFTNPSEIRQEFYKYILPGIKLRDDGFTQSMESRDLFKNTGKDKMLALKLREYVTKGGMSGISMMDMATIDTIIDLYVRQYAKNTNNSAKINSMLKTVEKGPDAVGYDKARNDLDEMLVGETELVKEMSKKIIKNINRTQPTSDPQYIQDIRKMNEAMKFITMFKTQPLQNIENLVVGFKKGHLTGDWEKFGESAIKFMFSMAMFTAIGRLMIDEDDELIDDGGVWGNYGEDFAMNTLKSIPGLGELHDAVTTLSGSAAENHPVQQIIGDAKKVYQLVEKQFDDELKKARRARKDAKLNVDKKESNPLEYVDNLRTTEYGQIADILGKYITGLNVGNVTKSLKQVEDLFVENTYEKAKKESEKSKYRTNTEQVSQVFKDAGDRKGLKRYKSMLRYEGKDLKEKQRKRVENR